jgi:hypothetical protein
VGGIHYHFVKKVPGVLDRQNLSKSAKIIHVFTRWSDL